MASPPSPDAFVRHSLFSDRADPEDAFPFETVFSIDPLVAHWQQLAEAQPEIYGATWAGLAEELAEAPELQGVVCDGAVLDDHGDLIDRIVRPLFPTDDWATDARALSAPFGGLVLRRTPQYERALGEHAERSIEAINNHDAYARTLYAYKAVLGRFYGITLRLDQPLVFVVPDRTTGLRRYFKLNASTRFAGVEATGPLPELSPDALDRMLRHVGDLAVWRKVLPPDRFRFSGLTVTRLTDVTHETATAAITHLVLTSDADLTDEVFDAVETEARTFFATPSLRLGLAALQADGALNLRSRRKIWNSLALRDALRDGRLATASTPYARALETGEPLMIRDVEAERLDPALASALTEAGVRSLFLQPLQTRGRTVGLAELTSSEPGAVDASTVLKMRRVETVLALALYQTVERFETRVGTAIQERYTAIHPSVRWRFREAAIAALERGDDAIEPEPIVFDGVAALYLAADIRASTRHRNEAVRHDMLARLRRALRAVRDAHAASPLFVLDELRLRIEERLTRYEAAWNAGDEPAAIHFLEAEVIPLLDAVLGEGRHALAAGEPEAARSGLFEESRRQINRTIADVLLADEAEAQAVVPHYVERTKTDGVEQTAYVGAAIAPGRRFAAAFVRDLRLRQLVAACRIAREVQTLQESLPVALGVAPLVVVQHAPVTLRFRTDETRFDVEGAAGVRFEMLKKRLDKACIKGTDERITQPDTVAVVVSTEAEAAEYRRFAAYLASAGWTDGAPAAHDVEDLPGASGLTLLRLSVRAEP